MREPLNYKERDAFEQWPFLANIELPSGMWWKELKKEPCIGTHKDSWIGWVTMDKDNLNHIVNWKGVTYYVGPDIDLQSGCIALANYAWTLGE